MDMAIAAASVGLAQGKAMQDLGMAVLKKDLGNMQESAAAVLPDAAQAMGVGTQLDISA